MKNKNLKVLKVMMLFYSFLLLVVSSYAWMNYSDAIFGKTTGLIFTDDQGDGDALQVTNKDLSASLYVFDVDLQEYKESNSVNDMLIGIVPNDTIYYKLELVNNTDSMIVCDVLFYGIRTNNIKMFNYLYTGLNKVSYTIDGNDVQVDNKPSIFCDGMLNLNEVKQNVYSYEMIKAVPIPGRSVAVLDCFFYFDREATLEDTANSYINIDKIILAI